MFKNELIPKMNVITIMETGEEIQLPNIGFLSTLQ
jgi:hypothetical protein